MLKMLVLGSLVLSCCFPKAFADIGNISIIDNQNSVMLARHGGWGHNNHRGYNRGSAWSDPDYVKPGWGPDYRKPGWGNPDATRQGWGNPDATRPGWGDPDRPNPPQYRQDRYHHNYSGGRGYRNQDWDGDGRPNWGGPDGRPNW